MSDGGGDMREAMFYGRTVDNGTADIDGLGRVTCLLCHHQCGIPDGAAGYCGVRVNKGGVLYASAYGKCSALNLDPIEKKPLHRFHPGGMILSVGGFGCNMRCPFCQNFSISTEYGSALNGSALSNGASNSGIFDNFEYISPEAIVSAAKELTAQKNIGVAYTYNEPAVGIEFLLDCARLVREAGLFNVLVSNGCVSARAREELAPYLDAANVDLKCFSRDYYRKLGGDLDAVKDTIAFLNGKCHVEVTTLIIPGGNDSEEELEALARWLAGVNPEIPLHLSRFFPRYKYAGKQPTPVSAIFKLKSIAEKFCKFVYAGNV